MCIWLPNSNDSNRNNANKHQSACLPSLGNLVSCFMLPGSSSQGPELEIEEDEEVAQPAQSVTQSVAQNFFPHVTCPLLRPLPNGASGERVFLRVYDVSHSWVSYGLNSISPKGIFHTGVEVYGSEWSFGHAETLDPTEELCGLSTCQPGAHPHHRFRETLSLGFTYLTQEEVMNVINELGKEWTTDTYDLLERNCNHFSTEFCSRLGVFLPPPWVNELAGLVSALAW
eukprot:TRINITY_DN22728_c0_g1_i2.p1 TRINITY_DN22728_c0_g1~~TRINITY_DN22728_c0_g1_i2.p1  ORF type:complete len:228 (-),score=17.92 TRINITY_DN22728_c0_g1_i2:504-1187(-)